MKNIDILNLQHFGVLAITANDLDAAHAYKVIGFKRAVKKAFDNIVEAEKEILKEVKIEDPQAFDKERDELKKSGSNPKRLAELDKTFDRYNELRKKLYEEDAKLDCKTMPYEQFHVLQHENKGMKPQTLNIFEEVLEGVLWAAQEETE